MGLTYVLFSSELHLIRSSRHLERGFKPNFLPAALDAIDEVERINGFWTVLIVNNYWVIARGSPSAISYDIPIDTPWPLETEEYVLVSFVVNFYRYALVTTIFRIS